MSLGPSRSSNSGGSSKRSLNNSGSSSKTKSSKQKTLGMAWGANSLSSSRSSFRNSPFSSFGSYMTEKNRKLHDQFQATASTSLRSEKLFHGVSIFVDGFTIPSSQELKGYMLKYGGQFENYFSRRRVTHIICSNLPDSKIKNLRSFSGGLPVVKPTWIVDSVVANKLLSWVPYQLDQLNNNQPKLSAFFALRNCPGTEGAVTTAVCEDDLGPSLKGDLLQDENLSEVDEPTQNRKQLDHEFDDPECESEEGDSIGDESLEVRWGEPSSNHTEDGNNLKNEFLSYPQQISASNNSYCSGDQNLKESTSSAVVVSSSRHHSTFGDPNFVENYFKSSRLHFIGTWRNRYHKRFPASSSDFQCKSSSSIASDNAGISTIIHIDMDCFFVSVVIRNHPELRDKPVAVSHSDSPKGTAEISSANYPARNYGVKAGIFVKDAKALCPQLVILPYNFQAYEEVADQFYNILHKHSKKVQAVSCDEAFLDVTDSDCGDVELLASTIRKEIFGTTGCTASAGIAANMLLARLATRSAKPDGQCYIPAEKVDEYLHQLPIKALPGIGYVLEQKLKKQGIHTCGELRLISKDRLQKDFGMKTGEMLWNYCRGVDNRMVGVIRESKSIGAEVNWGVRFKDLQDSHCFLLNLCKEVSLRLQGCGVHGRTFTLKIKKRRKDAEEPIKFMGCGDCENLSHSMTVPIATDDVKVLQRIANQLFGSFNLDVKDIRGVGLQVSKLENADASRYQLERNSLRSWLSSASTTTEEQSNINRFVNDGANTNLVVRSISEASGQQFLDQTVHSAHNSVSAPPPLSSLDVGVLESLPPELFSELNDIYGGQLVDFVTKSKCSRKNTGGSVCPSNERVEAVIDNSEGLVASVSIPIELNRNRPTARNAQSASTSEAGSCNEVMGSGKNDVMPSSLSQIDMSVLEQFPQDLRVDILGLLPAHSKEKLTSNAASDPLIKNPEDSLETNATGPQLKSIDCISNLWIGNPPKWIDIFKASNCLMLNTIAEMCQKLGSTGNLSLLLKHVVSRCTCPLDESGDGWSDEATSLLCELLKQYIHLKIESDIEEIYVCFRLLRRFTTKSTIFSQVYNMVFPYLQESVGEKYGGTLSIPPND